MGASAKSFKKKAAIKDKTTDQVEAEAMSNDSTADVLYQKIGNKWYAFSVINDEVFMGSIPEDQIEQFTKETVPEETKK